MKKKKGKKKVAQMLWTSNWSWYDKRQKPEKPKKVKFVAIYEEMVKDETFIDAWETFTDLKDVIDWLKSDHGGRNIKVYPVGKEVEFKRTITLKKKRK